PASAALVQTLLVTLPWILVAAVTSMAEMPFLAASSAALFVFLRSSALTSLRPALVFGGLAALAIALRPIEGCLLAGPLLTTAAVAAMRGGRLDRVSLGAVGACLVATVAMYLARIGWPGALAIQMTAAAGLGFAASRNARLRALLLSGLICYLGIVLWYTPFFSELHYWIYWANLGPESLSMGMRGGVGVIALLVTIVLWTGGNAVIALSLLALGLRRKQPPAHVPSPLIALLSGPVLMFAGATLTNNAEHRFYFYGFLVLLAALATYALHRSRRLAAGVIGTLIAANVLYGAINLFSLLRPTRFGEQAPAEALYSVVRPIQLWPSVPSLPWILEPQRTAEPSLDFVNAVAGAIGTSEETSVGFLKIHTETRFDQAITPGSCALVSREGGRRIDFEYPYDDGFDAVAPYLAEVRKRFPYVVTGPMEATEIKKRVVASAAHELIDAYRNGGLAALGFRPLGAIPFTFEGRSDSLLLLERLQ
ncbi:MAG: hypothetical protein ACXVBW_14070, partial [Bdellovibrionota bacterium]